MKSTDKNKFVSILVPSRGRPDKLKKFLDHLVIQTFNLNDIEVIVRLDNDDKISYQQLFNKYKFCKFIFGDKVSMGKLNKDCIMNSSANYVFFSNDDVLFKTKNWDRLLKKKISDFDNNFFLMYPNDLYKGKKLATFPILNKNIILKYPFLFPEYYQGSFIDLHVMDIFKQYNRGKNLIYLEELICEHLHFRKENKLPDTTYIDRKRFGDDHTFIKLATYRKLFVKNISSNKEFKCCKIENNYNSILNLLIGYSSLGWRLKLFFYMLCRKIYNSF